MISAGWRPPKAGLSEKSQLCAASGLSTSPRFSRTLRAGTMVPMTGVDGLELTRQLKRDPARRDIVIVALTAFAMKGDEDKARAAGCDGYITKPIDVLTLPATIAAYLR